MPDIDDRERVLELLEEAERRKILSDREYRINTIYKILNSDGECIPFRRNFVQRDFNRNRHGFDLVLKARQHGFTTDICIDFLDDALFTPNLRVAHIAHTKEDVGRIFNDKVKFAYDHLPQWVKDMNPAENNSRYELSFKNGSHIRVGMSFRSGTIQRLHISEYGKICAKYPEKAREVRTGALNTVHRGQKIIIESTAEGRDGHFYQLCQSGMSNQNSGRRLPFLSLVAV